MPTLSHLDETASEKLRAARAARVAHYAARAAAARMAAAQWELNAANEAACGAATTPALRAASVRASTAASVASALWWDAKAKAAEAEEYAALAAENHAVVSALS